MFIGALIYGLVNAATLALYAVGFSLTFGISGIANFAYGALYVLTGFLAWTIIHRLGLPLGVGLAGAVLVTAVLAGGLYRLLLARLRGLAESEVIATFGCGLVLLEALRWLGFTGPDFVLPSLIDGEVTISWVVLDYQRVLILAVGVGLTVGLWAFTHHTRWGRAFRGMAQDERTAISLGIDADKTAALAMTLGGALCAVAAVAVMPLGSIQVDSGYDVLLQALGVSIVGGLGSVWGVLAAGALLGLAQTFAALYWGSHWMMIVTLLAILAILVLRPSGLFGRQKELEERT